MNEIREYHTYEDTTATSTAMLGFLVIALLVVVGIAMAVWQPWVVTSPAPSNDTTIIERPAPAVNPPSNTTIINPPADSGGDKTDINIDTTGGTGSTGDTGTTGGG